MARCVDGVFAECGTTGDVEGVRGGFTCVIEGAT